jgi:hypothetical protein
MGRAASASHDSDGGAPRRGVGWRRSNHRMQEDPLGMASWQVTTAEGTDGGGGGRHWQVTTTAVEPRGATARVMVRVEGAGGTVIWHQGGLVGRSGPDRVASWDRVAS